MRSNRRSLASRKRASSTTCSQAPRATIRRHGGLQVRHPESGQTETFASPLDGGPRSVADPVSAGVARQLRVAGHLVQVDLGVPAASQPTGRQWASGSSSQPWSPRPARSPAPRRAAVGGRRPRPAPHHLDPLVEVAGPSCPPSRCVPAGPSVAVGEDADAGVLQVTAEDGLHRMLSLTPGTPGSSGQQMPRMTSSIWTPA